MSSVLLDVDGHVATITLNRPEQLNALDAGLREALQEAIRTVDETDAVRVAILTGAGRAFCAGGDIADMRRRLEEGWGLGRRRDHYLHGSARLVENLAALRKPLIAAVNGAAVGAGCNLVLLADIRIAARSATFGQVFVRRGLMPDFGGTYLLPETVGHAAAMELALTGRIIDSEEARALGLVNRVVDDADLLGQARAVADAIAANAPLAVQATKAALTWTRRHALAAALDLEAEGQARLQGTEDYREAVYAFLEKRPAQFSGR
jgi:enoyl-CoA hydratase/carnithine racemase